MSTKAELSGLQTQLHQQQTSLHNFQADQIKLQGDYDACMLRIQQLEQELSDVLYYKQNILKKVDNLEGLVSSEGSRLSKIQCVRYGQLEGRFLERMQSRMEEHRKKQALALATIKDNLGEIKAKTQALEDDIENERRQLMHVDNLISQRRASIAQQQTTIAQLEGNIRGLS